MTAADDRLAARIVDCLHQAEDLARALLDRALPNADPATLAKLRDLADEAGLLAAQPIAQAMRRRR